jgi:hypothetical protein
MIYEKRTLYVFRSCDLYHQEPEPVKNVHDARFFTDENEVFEVMGEDALSAGECVEVEVTVATPSSAGTHDELRALLESNKCERGGCLPRHNQHCNDCPLEVRNLLDEIERLRKCVAVLEGALRDAEALIWGH